MNEETVIIKLDAATPLPCSIYDPGRDAPCGKPAFVAYAYAHRHAAQPSRNAAPPLLIEWLVQPVCKECAAKAAKVYE